MNSTVTAPARSVPLLDAFDVVEAAGNPLIPGCGEPSMWIDDDGVTVHCVFRHVPSGGALKYSYADNALLDNWAEPTDLDITYASGTTGYFPEVKRVGSTYYMALKHAFSTGGVYLYTATAPEGPWTVANGGDPVIEPGANATDYNHVLYNVGFCVDNDKIHWLIESTTALGAELTGHLGVGPFGVPMWLTYGVSTLASPEVTMPTYPTIEGGGNPNLFWIAERNAILALYAATELGSWPAGLIAEDTRHRLRAAWAFPGETNDLAIPDCWYLSAGLWEATDGSQRQPGDANLLFTPGKTHAAVLLLNVDQATGWQGYLPRRLAIGNEADLFDRLTGSTFAPSGLTGGLSYRQDCQRLGQTLNQSIFGGSLALLPRRGELFTVIYVCDKDNPSTKYGNVTWDSANDRFEIDTFGHLYPVRIQGSEVQILSAITTDVSVYRPGSGLFPQINVGEDSGHKIDVTWDNDNDFAEINTSSRAYPIHYGASVHQFGKTVQIVGFSNPPNGAGIEAGYDGAQGIIQVFDRGAASGKAMWLNVGVGSVRMGSAGGVHGFFEGAGTTKQAITGSRGSNAALASLLTALAAYGLIVDSSS